MTNRFSAAACVLIAVLASAIAILARQPGAAPNALTVGAPIHHVFDDRMAREPMIVEHPTGALFVAGYGMLNRPWPEGPPNLWKSADGGKSFSRVDVGTTDQGALGNSDVDLAVGPEGTLYFATMTFDSTLNQGVNINIGVSSDVGATWAWTQLSNTRWDDRPWVEVAPDGTAHVIWNDGEGVSYAVSTDRGKTWVERPRIHPQGGSSHLAVGPNGEVAVRITPVSASSFKRHPDVELIAVSVDGGRTWTKHRAPGERTWGVPVIRNELLPRWVEPIAWDASGALYSLWTDPAGIQLAQSRDLGNTWRQSLVSETKNTTAFFPYLVARGNGELAATWFEARMPGHGSLRTHVARFQVSEDRKARNVRIVSLEIDVAIETGPPTGGEYFPVVFLRNGGLAAVTTIQNRAAKRLGFSYWSIAD